MGSKARLPRVQKDSRTGKGSVVEVFHGYAAWFQASYLPSIAEDEDAELEWSNPLADLKVVTAQAFAELQGSWGQLPESYRDILLQIGVGPLWIAADEEPAGFTILPPKDVAKVREDCLSWIDKEMLALAQKRQNIDGNKLVPILVDRDWNQWALLANQWASDDRVVLFSHGQEQREDSDLFRHGGTIEAYFGELFANAKKRYSPWYMWTGFKH